MTRSQSGNTQLLGLAVVALFLLAAGAFLFFSGDSQDELPIGGDPVIEAQDPDPIEAAGPIAPITDRNPAEDGVASRTEIEKTPDFTADGDTIGATVSGKVVDENGKPVAEAIVSVAQRYSAGGLLSDFEKAEKFDVETDSQGRFRFRRLPANKDMNLWVYHGDFAPTQGPAFASLADESQELPPIVLRMGYSMSGWVKDTGGNPLAAKVELRRQQSGFVAGTPEQRRDEDLALGRLLEVEADDEGRFEIHNIAEGIWILRASYEGFATAEVRPLLFLENKNLEDQKVVLEDEHHIAGRAVDENDQPVANALVNVSRIQPRPILTANTRTLEDGTFDVRGLAAGVYGLSVQAEGYTNGHAGRVEADTTTLVVVMQVKAGVTGRVTDPDGNPVTQFQLEILRTRAGNKQYGITGKFYEITSPDGTYRLDAVDPGTYILLARAPGMSATYSPSFRVDREQVDGIDIPLRAGGVVVGQVRDGTTDEPLVGATISLHGDEYNPDEVDSLFGAALGDPNNIPALTATTDKDGRFRLDNAFPGTVQILIDHPRYLSELVATTVIDNSEQDLGVVRVYKGGSIFGIAKNKEGEPMTGGTVNLSRQEGSAFFHRSATVDARGRFRFDGLKAGGYEVVAYPSADNNTFLFPPEGDKKSVYVGDGADVEVELNSSL